MPSAEEAARGSRGSKGGESIYNDYVYDNDEPARM